MLPLFYEFADNEMYFKMLYDFSTLNLAEMDPAKFDRNAEGNYFDNPDSLVYAPQVPVDMTTMLTPEAQELFFGKAESMMAMENQRAEQLFGTVANPSQTFVDTMEKLEGIHLMLQGNN